MTRRLPVLVIYSYQLGMFKRYHFSMERIRKSYPFCQKWYTYVKWSGDGPRGRASPHTLLSNPPGSNAVVLRLQRPEIRTLSYSDLYYWRVIRYSFRMLYKFQQ